MRALIYLCLALSMASPAHAELRDLRARLSGQEGLIWIAFDGQPTVLRRERTASGLDLVIEGIEASPHHIIPRRRELVTAIEVEPTERGVRIQVRGAQAWSASEAELRLGGVLVRVQLAAGAAATEMAPAAPAYPAAAPGWQPTPTTGHDPASPASIPPPARAEPHTPQPQTPSRPPAPGEPSRASSMPAQAASMAAAALPAELTACADAAAAVEANPWDDARLMQHAGCLARAGETAAASRIYEQMLAFEPENVTVALALADLRLQQGDRAAARALYLRAASHATSDSEALRARGQAQLLQPE